MRQTHGSVVFLAGEWAYKVKKPVNFGFLDYSTLDRRERLCRREVELNARLCPEVYLGVVPVVQDDDAGQRWVIGVTGDPRPVVEWAVRMRRLPEEWMLPVRLPCLSPPEVERLARVLARFHAAVETNDTIRRFGAPAVLRQNSLENFAVLQQAVPTLLPAGQLAAIRDWTENFLATCDGLFRARMAGGRIRDGHGDLRLQNICMAPGIQDGLQIFDCIEFNDRFRFEDVAADLAYLAMDLDLAGRTDLRTAVVRAYFRESGDIGLEAVLPFYLGYRACVRGKIAFLASEEAEIAAEERARHRDLARAAFDLARSYTVPPVSPELWILVGYSGSGKSVLARELCRRMPAVRLSSDAVRKELAGVPATGRLRPDQYADAPRARVYAELRTRAARYLREGRHVVLDATFLDPGERTAAAELATSAGIRLRAIVCRCPDPVIRERLASREQERRDASDAGIAVYEAQMREHPLPQGPPSPEADFHGVDTARPPHEVAREILQAFWW